MQINTCIRNISQEEISQYTAILIYCSTPTQTFTSCKLLDTCLICMRLGWISFPSYYMWIGNVLHLNFDVNKADLWLRFRWLDLPVINLFLFYRAWMLTILYLTLMNSCFMLLSWPALHCKRYSNLNDTFIWLNKQINMLLYPTAWSHSLHVWWCHIL